MIIDLMIPYDSMIIDFSDNVILIYIISMITIMDNVIISKFDIDHVMVILIRKTIVKIIYPLVI